MSEKANKLFKEIECKELSEFVCLLFIQNLLWITPERSLEFAHLQLTKESIRFECECELNQHSSSIGDCVK